jgi:tripartite-type tricarboxylate transporter receptor subunit TctC
MRLRVRFFCAALIAAAGGSAAAFSWAQAPFPERVVRWVVPYPPGGSIDIVGRVIAARLSHHWGLHAVVDNRAGAGGRVGVQAVIGAAADGYTQLLALNTNYTIDRSLFKDLGYDPEKALLPVTIVASTSQLLIGNLSFPPRNVKELVALAKAQPNEIHYGSSGAGGSLHLAIELFKSKTGIRMTHVPYQGGVPAAADLIAGHIQVMFINTPAGAPYVKAGRVRALGISTAQRSAQLPAVPTIAEAGVPGFNLEVWYGLSLPAGAAPAVAGKMYQDVTRVLEEADVRKQLTGYGAEPLNVTPGDMAKRIRAETAAWAKVIQGSMIRFE